MTLNCETKDGKPADLWHFLGIHEETERAKMAGGLTYDKAHTDSATPKEKAAVEAECGQGA